MTKQQLNNIKAQIADFEKDIQIDGLSDWIEELKKENEELKQRLSNQAESIASYEQEHEELKKQIEKMKQCGNCGNGTIGNCEYCRRKHADKTDDYWQLKR